MKNPSLKIGTYLVRNSSRNEGAWVLSLKVSPILLPLCIQCGILKEIGTILPVRSFELGIFPATD